MFTNKYTKICKNLPLVTVPVVAKTKADYYAH